VNGTTSVRSSPLEGLESGLSVVPVVLRRGVFLGTDASVRDLVLMVELAVGAITLPGVRAGALAVDFADFCGLVCGLILGVLCWTPARRLAAYGSAVAGLAVSGLRGRRTGAAMSELPAEVCIACVLLDVSRDRAEGGRAAAALGGAGRPLIADEPVDFAGVK
jgi:hypothetical protein